MSQIALITGATSGIGEACAKLFAKNKFNLILTGRRAERLDQLAHQLTMDFDIEVQTLTFDVQNKQSVEENLENLNLQWQDVDVLINNAGLSLGLEPIDQGNTNDWDIMIDTNIKGLLYVTRIVSGWMVKRRKGHIINLGSIAGKETYANGNVYCATKHAVDSLNKAMRIDLLQYGIKVTGVHPGAVETEFSEVRFKGDLARAKKVYEGFDALSADDIAETIWFAVSRPAHVNINDLVIMPTAQASSVHLFKNLHER
ncbi:SDR family NAD(P)-dependent oxidoreductase [Desertivirga xinjiangensis]|uniref:SDR family NAD(P)-dependent oxidoreductase n=1 Tax=Desertivirga xinjiangensis TaxID=539206 RepID=UPI00210C00DA|nr:SDR family NAD(P)-dependent oxidoreductase [Pedobacter xinjiangensis]